MSEEARPRRLETGWSVLLVVAAFGLSLLPLLAGFIQSETFTAEEFGTAESWARWDSNRYEEIAESGYYLRRCSSRGSVGGSIGCGGIAAHPALP